jgi:hypothetical protein
LLARNGLYARLYRMTYEQATAGDGHRGSASKSPLPAG